MTINLTTELIPKIIVGGTILLILICWTVALVITYHLHKPLIMKEYNRRMKIIKNKLGVK